MAKQQPPAQPATISAGNPGAPMAPSPNKSCPAPKAAPSPGLLKVLSMIALAGAALALVTCVARVVRSDGHSKPPPPVGAVTAPAQTLPNDATDLPRAWNPDGSRTDVSKWPSVEVPAKGDSKPVPTFEDRHIVWATGLKVFCVYSDDHTEAAPCTEGPQRRQYVHNDSDFDAYAPYAYAKRDEK
ncbi:MAG: hypothetical protein RLZZ26_401 [Candidatus Parcubacteria bacterium]|jgi:hypothetical protein